MSVKNISPEISPVGLYDKGNTEYKKHWQVFEEYSEKYINDEFLHNILTSLAEKYQKIFEDSVYATAFQFRMNDTDGTVKRVIASKGETRYEVIKNSENLYEVIVPKDDTNTLITVAAVDDDCKCIKYEESGFCSQFSMYGGGYSFYNLSTNQ